MQRNFFVSLKRICILTAMTLMVIAGLTGCGNKLKTLPSVSTDNITTPVTGKNGEEYISPENQAIISAVSSYETVFGNLQSVTVYDRKDNVRTKENSAIYTQVVTNLAYATYTYYLKCDMLYDKEIKAWTVSAVSYDENNPFNMDVTLTYDTDKIKEDIVANEYSFYFSDVETYVKPDSIDEVTINSISCNTIDEYRAGSYYDITFTLKDGYYYYDCEGTVTYIYYRPDYYGEECINYYGCETVLVSRYVDPDTKVRLSDSSMLQDLLDYGYEIGSNDYKSLIVSDLIDSYTFDDPVYTDTNCTRHMSLVLKATDGVLMNYDIEYKYDYTDGVWSINYINAYRAEESYTITEDFYGNYSGLVVVGDAEVGIIKFAIDEYDPEENKFTGYVQYTKDNDFSSAEVVNLTGKYVGYDWQVSLEFEKKIIFSGYTGKKTVSLYIDPNDGVLKTASNDTVKIEVWKQ